MTTRLTSGLTYELNLPYPRPPKALTANNRAHWRQRAADTRQVRGDVVTIARQAGLHRIGRIEHITAQLWWAPGDHRRRDSDNLFPLFKVLCDGLARGPRGDWVGLALVPDDTPEHFTKLGPVILPPPAARRMWLVLDVRLAEL